MAEPAKRAIPESKSILIPSVIIVVLLSLSGLLLWKFALSPKEPALTSETTSSEEQFTPRTTAPRTPPPSIPEPRFEPRAEPVRPPITVSLGDEQPEKDTPGATPTETVKVEVNPCQAVPERISSFFAQLEQRGYVRERELDEGIQAHSGRMIDRLLSNPPVVSGERDDLFTILNNTAHLFRVMQKDNLLLARDIFQHEQDSLEELFADLYRWSIIAGDCPPAGVGIHLPLAGLYEYAAFFTNTLGGRSYLFRRNQHTRLLANYYTALVIDQANRADLNRHGIDIRPLIRSLSQEIPNQASLSGREDYKKKINELEKHYRELYGPL